MAGTVRGDGFIEALKEAVRKAPDSQAPYMAANALIAAYGPEEAQRRASLLSACYAKHGDHGPAEAWRQVAAAVRELQARMDSDQTQRAH